MPTPCIEPGSQRWEASALTLHQTDSTEKSYMLIQTRNGLNLKITDLFFHKSWDPYWSLKFGQHLLKRV